MTIKNPGWGVWDTDDKFYNPKKPDPTSSIPNYSGKLNLNDLLDHEFNSLYSRNPSGSINIEKTNILRERILEKNNIKKDSKKLPEGNGFFYDEDILVYGILPKK